MNLLLCTDGTPRSEGALAFGIRLARTLEASITLLGACEATGSGSRPHRNPDGHLRAPDGGRHLLRDRAASHADPPRGRRAGHGHRV